VSYFSLTLLFTLCAYFVDYAFVIVVIRESYLLLLLLLSAKRENDQAVLSRSYVRGMRLCAGVIETGVSKRYKTWSGLG